MHCNPLVMKLIHYGPSKVLELFRIASIYHLASKRACWMRAKAAADLGSMTHSKGAGCLNTDIRMSTSR